jgi:hypothetical protein
MTDSGATGGGASKVKLKDMIKPGAGKALGKVALKAGAVALAIAVVAGTITWATH